MGAQPIRGLNNPTDRSMRDQINELFQLALGREIAPQENVSRENELAWDSLKHVELMFLLEDHFDLRFSESEMAAMDNAAEIARLVESKVERKVEMKLEEERAARLCDRGSGVPA